MKYTRKDFLRWPMQARQAILELQTELFLEREKEQWINVKDQLPQPSCDIQYLCYGQHPFNKSKCYFAARYLDKVSGWSICGIAGLNIELWNPKPLLINESPNPEQSDSHTNKPINADS